MNTKIKISFIVSILVLVIFYFALKNIILFEEILFLYLIPYLLFLIPVIIFILVKYAFKKKDTLWAFYLKLFVPSTLFQILLIILVFYFSPSKEIYKKDAVKDLDYMLKTIEDVHPNSYEQISKERFYSDVEKVKNGFPLKMKVEDFYRKVLMLNAEIKDGHTSPDLGYYFNSRYFFYKKIFPYKIKIVNDRIIVIENYSYKCKIPIGSEIIEINGISSNEVINKVSKLISYENEAFRNYYLSMPFSLSIWNNYEDYLIKYIEVNSNNYNTIETNGGLFAKINFIRQQMKKTKSFEFNILRNNIGYIEFNHFNNLDKFSEFLENTFTIIKNKNIDNILIDIRKNDGGNSLLGDELLQYISHKPFKQFERMIFKKSNEAVLSNKISDSDTNKIGTLVEYSNSKEIQLRENPLRFSGNCFLLVGGNTFSSASSFASTFQCYKVGKIIGSETGGLTVCYGDICSYKLPNSGIDMVVSCKKFYNTCGIDNRRGVIPDYIVQNSLEDEQNNFDRVLDYTLNIIKEQSTLNY